MTDLTPPPGTAGVAEAAPAPAPTPDLLLWLDCETAGPYLPDAAVDTVLEVAWTITYRYPRDLRYSSTLSSWQLTPLRSRYTALAPEGVETLFPVPGDHDDPDGWPETTGGFQRRMHATSGLTTDLINADGLGRVLHESVELQRLVLDDIDAAVDVVRAQAVADGGQPHELEPTPAIYLAGDGVGHYDRALITRELSRVDQWLHYRPVDISVALQTLSDVPSPTRHLLAQDDGTRQAFAFTLARADIEPRAAAVAGGVKAWLSPELVDPHRAAPDVVRSMLAYLVGRARVGDALSRTEDAA